MISKVPKKYYYFKGKFKIKIILNINSFMLNSNHIDDNFNVGFLIDLDSFYGSRSQ